MNYMDCVQTWKNGQLDTGPIPPILDKNIALAETELAEAVEQAEEHHEAQEDVHQIPAGAKIIEIVVPAMHASATRVSPAISAMATFGSKSGGGLMFMNPPLPLLAPVAPAAIR